MIILLTKDDIKFPSIHTPYKLSSKREQPLYKGLSKYKSSLTPYKITSERGQPPYKGQKAGLRVEYVHYQWDRGN